MVLPLIGAMLGPSLLGSAGLGLVASPLLAGAIGSGVGTLLQGGDLKQALGSGLGTYIGGSMFGGAGAEGGKHVAGAQGLPNTPPMPRPGMAQGTGLSSGIGGIADIFGTGKAAIGTGGMIGSMMGPAFFPQEYEKSERGPPTRVARDPIYRDVAPTPAGYRPGKDPEHRYFQPIYQPTVPMAQGGTVSPMAANRMALMQPAPVQQPTKAFGPMSKGHVGEGLLAMALAKKAQQNQAPRVGQSGGRAGLMETRRMAEGGLAAIADIMQQAAPEPKVDPKQAIMQMNDMEIVRVATMAIKGMLNDQEAALALGEFLKRNGEEKMQRLIKDVQDGKAEEFSRDERGLISGPGGGEDDLVPAVMPEANQPVLLSDGEYVVPQNKVAAIGNGDVDKGADEIEKMTNRAAMA